MSGFKSLEDIRVRNESISLVTEVYKVVRSSRSFSKDYGLSDQVRRSAVSIPSNISEGHERDSKQEFIRFLFIAKASCGELRTQLEIAYNLGYITKEEYDILNSKCISISKMIMGLIKKLKVYLVT